MPQLEDNIFGQVGEGSDFHRRRDNLPIVFLMFLASKLLIAQIGAIASSAVAGYVATSTGVRVSGQGSFFIAH